MSYLDFLRNPVLKPGFYLLAERCLISVASSKDNTYFLKLHVDSDHMHGGIERAAVKTFRTLEPYCGFLKIKKGSTVLNNSINNIECTMYESADAIHNGYSKIPEFIEALEQVRIISAISKVLICNRRRVLDEGKPIVVEGKYIKVAMPFNSLSQPLTLGQSLDYHTPLNFDVSSAEYKPTQIIPEDQIHNNLTLRLNNLGIKAKVYNGTGADSAVKLVVSDLDSQKKLIHLCYEYKELLRQRGK